MSTFLQVVGTGLIVAGATLIAIPLGFIVGGILVVVIGIGLGSK